MSVMGCSLSLGNGCFIALCRVVATCYPPIHAHARCRPTETDRHSSMIRKRNSGRCLQSTQTNRAPPPRKTSMIALLLNISLPLPFSLILSTKCTTTTEWIDSFSPREFPDLTRESSLETFATHAGRIAGIAQAHNGFRELNSSLQHSPFFNSYDQR
jgi:hypothetical protein